MLDKRKPVHVNPSKLSNGPKQKTLFDLFPNRTTTALPSRLSELLDERSEEPTKVEPVVPEATTCSKPQELSSAAAVKRLTEASPEPKPIHPFFNKPKPPPGGSGVVDHAILDISEDDPINVILLRETPEIGSQEDPIILDSPVRPFRPEKPDLQSGKPLAPLFKSLPSKSLNSRIVPELMKQEHVPTPYPDMLAQHVRGPQSSFRSPESPYGRKIPHGTPTIKQPFEQPLNCLQWIYKPIDVHPLVLPQQHVSVNMGQPRWTTISNENRQHPAISRLTDKRSPSLLSQRLWVDKWHPISATEVLGNESSAIYLRDWMRALELHLTTELTSKPDDDVYENQTKNKTRNSGMKRPRVVRAVAKHRGRKKQRLESDDEDDWIVYSDSAEKSDDTEGGFDDYLLSSPSRRDWGSSHLSSPFPAPMPHPVSTSQSSFEPLTNTILLTGPPGVGKTAAVYACAEELGWDVLEVYPGIGKRNASSIDSLIGDAGKNHHVRAMKGGTIGTLSKYTSSVPSKRLEDGEEVPGPTSPNKAGDTQMHPETSESLTHPADAIDPALAVRQSLILLEEADIQFKEDASFWPAVIGFIKDCRRPVVITCNDISLVPTGDLPLQTVLHFQSCPSALATSYLDALCSAEGYSLEGESLLRLYEGSSYKLEAIDDFLPPTSCDFPAPDLRRTINYLQFYCSSIDSESGTFRREDTPDCDDEGLFDWNDTTEERPSRKSPDGVSADQGLLTTPMGTRTPPRRMLAARHSELISFADSQLMRKGWDTEEAATLGNSEPSNDDQVGHPILFRPKLSETVFSGSRAQDGEIVSAVMWLSRAEMTAGATREPVSTEIPFRTRELFRARVDHRYQMKQALGGVVPLPLLMMRHTTARLDYLTRVRDIMETEDEQEKAQLQRIYKGRRTRNSSKLSERIYEFTDESRQALGGVIL